MCYFVSCQLSEKEKLVSSNEEKTAALTKTHTQGRHRPHTHIGEIDR